MRESDILGVDRTFNEMCRKGTKVKGRDGSDTGGASVGK